MMERWYGTNSHQAGGHVGSQAFQVSQNPVTAKAWHQDSRDMGAAFGTPPAIASTGQIGHNALSSHPTHPTGNQFDAGPAQLAAGPLPTRSRIKRRYLIAGGVLAALIVLAAVLGGVLGSRASSSKNSSSTNSSSTTSLVQPGRVPSQTGAWNGTALTANGNGTQGWLFFQDHTGAVNCLVFEYSNQTHALTLQAVDSVEISAANGTGLACIIQAPNTQYLAYTNAEGYLADAIQLDPPLGPWSPGKLSSQRIAVPTDNRPAMWWDKGWFITDSHLDLNETGGFNVYAGGMDGIIHRYAGDLNDYNNNSWVATSTHDFLGSWAYGGIQTFTGLDSSEYNVTLIALDQGGDLIDYLQENENATLNSTYWERYPDEGPWTSLMKVDQTTSANSSLAYHLDYENSRLLILSASPDGNIGSQEFSLSQTYPSQFGQYNSSVRSNNGEVYHTMQGTDFADIQLEVNSSVLFYQDEGPTIAFIVLNADGTSGLNSGNLVFINGTWSIT